MRDCAHGEMWDRLCVRADIEQTWEQNPRWMGVFTSRYLSPGSCPWPLYREVFATMIARGLLLETADDRAGFARYMLARLIPLPTRKGETR